MGAEGFFTNMWVIYISMNFLIATTVALALVASSPHKTVVLDVGVRKPTIKAITKIIHSIELVM